MDTRRFFCQLWKSGSWNNFRVENRKGSVWNSRIITFISVSQKSSLQSHSLIRSSPISRNQRRFRLLKRTLKFCFHSETVLKCLTKFQILNEVYFCKFFSKNKLQKKLRLFFSAFFLSCNLTWTLKTDAIWTPSMTQKVRVILRKREATDSKSFIFCWQQREVPPWVFLLWAPPSYFSISVEFRCLWPPPQQTPSFLCGLECNDEMPPEIRKFKGRLQKIASLCDPSFI